MTAARRLDRDEHYANKKVEWYVRELCCIERQKLVIHAFIDFYGQKWVNRN